MKKIGIITINDRGNFGNRLQNYALQEMLKAYGEPCTIFCHVHENDVEPNVFVKIACAIKKNLLSFIRCCIPGFQHVKGKREFAFREFTSSLVPDDVYSVDSVNGLLPRGSRFDVIVIGSDQVWNDRWITKAGMSLRLGSFVQDANLISYAASIGVDSVSSETKSLYKQYLPRFQAIAVREFKAKEIVEQSTGCNATVVLDPTLMISAEEWLKITRNFVKTKEKYVLTYFLGGLNTEYTSLIQRYADEHDCVIRRLGDESDLKTFGAGPRDFVELFAKAEYVFTDSYHACCFSILFNKQFKVLNRMNVDSANNMNSRMNTLFQLFDLDKSLNFNDLNEDIDYDKINEKLTQYRAESNLWLEQAILM